MSTYSIYADIWSILQTIRNSDVALAEELSSALAKSIVSPRSSEFQASASNSLTEIEQRVQQEELVDVPDLQSAFSAAKTSNSDLANRFVHLLASLKCDPDLCEFLCAPEKLPKIDFRVTKNRSGDLSFLKKQLDKVVKPEQIAAASTLRQRKNELQNLPLSNSFKWKRQRKWAVETEILSENKAPFDTSLSAWTAKERESAMIQDLMLCFEGFQGENIRAVDRKGDGNIEFEVNPSFSPPFREIAFRCLPVASAFHRVNRFVQSRSDIRYGMINQALCKGMETILQEYRTLICRFFRENKASLTVEKLSFQINPILVSMQILAEICDVIEVNGFIGGRILSLLHEKQSSYVGVSRARDICFFLAKSASVPFFKHMLPRWLFHGVVVDPCREFMIFDSGDRASKSFNDSDADFDETDSWQKRYVLKAELCPSFLKPVSEEILKCGKNLNILASCGTEFDFGDKSELRYSVESKDYLFVIEEACVRANRALLDFLIKDHQLFARFRSMKQLFLVERGDWLLQFMVNAHKDLLKPVDYTHIDRLQTTLDDAISLAFVGFDPMKEEIKAEVIDHSLTAFLNYVISLDGREVSLRSYRERMMIETDGDLKGIEGFCLSWEPQWPLSLVFNPKSLLQYKILFRRLLMCKNVERMLCKSWVEGKKTLAACVLRQKMLAFVQNYMFYCMEEIVAHNWTTFRRDVIEATSIDDVLKAHGNMLDTCTKDCMLTDRDLVETIEDLLKLGLQFALSPTMRIERVMKVFENLLDSLFENVRKLDNQHKVWNNFLYRLSSITTV